MLKLKMYPATNGDAFLIKVELPNPIVILIDAGYTSTFDNYISSVTFPQVRRRFIGMENAFASKPCFQTSKGAVLILIKAGDVIPNILIAY